MTPWFLHTLHSDLRRSAIAEGLVRALGVVVAHPGGYRLAGIADGFEALPPAHQSSHQGKKRRHQASKSRVFPIPLPH